MPRVTNPEFSVFEYDYRRENIRLSVEPSVFYHMASKSFQVDQNPAGERMATPIHDLEVAEDGSRVSFSCSAGGRLEKFLISSDQEVDHVLNRFMRALATGRSLACDPTGDVVEFSFRRGDFTGMSIFRSIDGVVEKSVRLTVKDGGALLVIPSPWSRTPVEGVKTDGDVLVAYGLNSEVAAEYELMLPGWAKEMMNDLFTVAGLSVAPR